MAGVQQSGKMNQAGDPPGRPDESGEPRIAGRQHGRVIEERGGAAGSAGAEDTNTTGGQGRKEKGASPSPASAPESGRHRAVP